VVRLCKVLMQLMERRPEQRLALERLQATTRSKKTQNTSYTLWLFNIAMV
jgi:hypothetical protein